MTYAAQLDVIAAQHSAQQDEYLDEVLAAFSTSLLAHVPTSLRNASAAALPVPQKDQQNWPQTVITQSLNKVYSHAIDKNFVAPAQQQMKQEVASRLVPKIKHAIKAEITKQKLQPIIDAQVQSFGENLGQKVQTVDLF